MTLLVLDLRVPAIEVFDEAARSKCEGSCVCRDNDSCGPRRIRAGRAILA